MPFTAWTTRSATPSPIAHPPLSSFPVIFSGGMPPVPFSCHFDTGPRAPSPGPVPPAFTANACIFHQMALPPPLPFVMLSGSSQPTRRLSLSPVTKDFPRPIHNDVLWVRECLHRDNS